MADLRTISLDPATGRNKQIRSPDVNLIDLAKITQYQDIVERAAPAVSAAGESRFYMDSTSKTVKLSQNGGAYQDLIGGGLDGAGSANKICFWLDADTITFDANFEFDPTVESLKIGALATTQGHVVIDHAGNTDRNVTLYVRNRYSGGSIPYVAWFAGSEGAPDRDAIVAIEAIEGGTTDAVLQFHRPGDGLVGEIRYDNSANYMYITNDFQVGAPEIILRDFRYIDVEGLTMHKQASWWASGQGGTSPLANRLQQPTQGNNVELNNAEFGTINYIRLATNAYDGNILIITKDLNGAYGDTETILSHNVANSGSDIGLWLIGEKSRTIRRGESVMFVLDTIGNDGFGGTTRKWFEIACSNPEPRVLNVGGHVSASTNVFQNDSTINVVASTTSVYPKVVWHQKGMASPRDFSTVFPDMDTSMIGMVNRAASSGGIVVTGASSNSAITTPLWMSGMHGHTAPTVATNIIRGGKTDGLGSIQNLADSEIHTEFRNWNETSKVIHVFGDMAISLGTTVKRERMHLHNPAAGGTCYLRITNDGTGTGASDGFNAGYNASEELLYENFEATDQVWRNNGADILRWDESQGGLQPQKRLLGKLHDSTIASASTIALGANGNLFEITGTTTINLIDSTNWTEGSIVTLHFASALTVNHNTANSGNNFGVLFKQGLNYSAGADTMLMLILRDTHWYEV